MLVGKTDGLAIEVGDGTVAVGIVAVHKLVGDIEETVGIAVGNGSGEAVGDAVGRTGGKMLIVEVGGTVGSGEVVGVGVVGLVEGVVEGVTGGRIVVPDFAFTIKFTTMIMELPFDAVMTTEVAYGVALEGKPFV